MAACGAELKVEEEKKLEKPELLLCGIDLDATVWHPEMYLLGTDNFVKDPKTKAVTNEDGKQMEILGDVVQILNILRNTDIQVVFVSRTSFPQRAHQCLKLLEIDEKGFTLSQMGNPDVYQIYPGDKKAHFSTIAKKTGVPYKNMLFFDDQERNVKSVAELGVTTVHVSTPKGLTLTEWEQGIKQFKKILPSKK